MSGASSQDNHQQLHVNANGDQKDGDVDSHIVELSEMFDREIRNNTWDRRSSQAETIFRVPKPKNSETAAADKMMSTYQPAFLSIGPYHANATEEIRRNEQRKLSALDKCINIQQGGRPSVLDYTQAVKSVEAEAKRCYEGEVGMDPDAFCKMLLLDAFYLIRLLEIFGHFCLMTAPPPDTASPSPSQQGSAAAASASPSPSQQGSPAAASPSQQRCKPGPRDTMMTVHDLMMLENQIPFLVVEKIYELWIIGDAAAAKSKPVRRLAWEAIRIIVRGVPWAAPSDDDLRLFKFQHLVHVCHVYLKPTCVNIDASSSRENLNDKGKKADKYGRFRRATEYYEAGVTFRLWRRSEASSASSSAAGSSSHAQQQQQQQQRRPMLDVAFTNGVLSVALQDIDEKTGYILRNVLAYEQKYGTSASYVTAYVVFMSQLLGTADDVALLSRRGVVDHLLGDDGEVCALFRGLADGLAFDPAGDHYLRPVGAALQEHCRHRRHRWRAWIVRHRFGNPWLVAAWLFGGSAVLCTIVQTVFTVLSYLQQPHS